jgi:hypothetical protein
VQKPTQAVKDLGNTFDINPKCARTLPSVIFHGLFKDSLNFFLIEVDIVHPAGGLRCRNPPRHLDHLMAWLRPLT